MRTDGCEDFYQEVALTRDTPEEDLRQGDVATLVDYVSHPQQGEEGAVLETGDTIARFAIALNLPKSLLALIFALM
jgi:hypothetical protein